MADARLEYLFERYIAKTCTIEEKQELAEILLANQYEPAVKELMLQAWNSIEPNDMINEEKADHIFESIVTKRTGVVIERKVIVRKMWRRVAAAACIVLLAGAGWYYQAYNSGNKKPVEIALTYDVAPPNTNRATITLANGQKVFLDSVKNGTLATQGSVNLKKLADGKIVYNALRQAQDDNGSMAYNTLSNPRGSKVIDMTLSDGTRVWLNAGSSVTYPVVFAGKERKVDIAGEAYFEVTHNAAMPFKVSKGSMDVTVLGTHFNVNAYEDEQDIKVTLLEGSVKASIGTPASSAGQAAILKPGEQAIVNNDKLKVSKGVDLKEVMAWKDGRFYFDGADIKTVMRQLARWYDVEVEYQADIKYSFVAKISRDVPVSDLLKILQLTEGVHFKVEGKKITVMK